VHDRMPVILDQRTTTAGWRRRRPWKSSAGS
jgi:hypothetical protein